MFLIISITGVATVVKHSYVRISYPEEGIYCGKFRRYGNLFTYYVLVEKNHADMESALRSNVVCAELKKGKMFAD